MLNLSKKLQWLILAGLVLALYWQVFMAWGADLWHDDNYSHGLLIPFVSLYFIRHQWQRLTRANRQPAFHGVWLVLAGLLLFLVGGIGAEFFSQRLSFVVLLYGLILFVEGRDVAAQLRFPIGILFFAIPLPYILYNAVAFPLKLVASQIAVFILKMIGMPVFREGNILQLSHTTLEVVDACSGIRSLMTLITLAFFLAVFMHRHFGKRLLVMAMALPVAVVANAGRVALTAVLTSYDPAWGSGTLHELAGWGVFVLSFLALGGISYLLQSARDKAAGAEEGA